MDQYATVNAYLRKITPDDLRILDEQLEVLKTSSGWKQLAALLRVEREQHVRQLCSPKVMEHAEYAFEGGYVAGAAAVFSILEIVRSKHIEVQSELARELREDERNDGES